MPIPDVPEIVELLSQLEVLPRAPTNLAGVIEIPFGHARDEQGGAIVRGSVWLQFPTHTKLTSERLVQRICSALRNDGHANGREFALFVLALAALTPTSQGSILLRLNKVLSSICDADVNLYCVLMMDYPAEFSFEIPPFKLGRLRHDKLKYNCERAPSDFFDRYGPVLRNRFAVERAATTVRVLDLPAIRTEFFAGMRFRDPRRPLWQWHAWESLLECYFSSYNAALFDTFWTEFSEAQDAYVTLGAPYVDTKGLETSIDSHRIAVFLNVGSSREGFVAPAGIGFLAVDLANVHVRVPRVQQELRQEYGFHGFDGTSLHNTLKLFSSFVSRARRHHAHANSDEALIHYIIALELIFGERQAIQKSVSERVAMITFHGSGRTFQQQRDWIEKLYSYRSKYVHEGRGSIGEVDLNHIQRLCEEVFRCLLRLQAANPKPRDRNEQVLERWLGMLDYLAKGALVDMPPTAMQMTDAHIKN